ncbi:bile acid:sodium symporter family protein [Allosaccharopolyspora coralli]|uniref:Bile acid:sodium symporter family protein n=1 Tax=Allosaccharopolyspora coralli TaxID=2665642 RepID=A0A5Q3Q8F2_9PSEU|nr:bile acid:sodium symporter family protein [Allosaccharopolyspora coralli]QGK70762.1 bile acid:sodium symporter family protein [Allosaccharopolyspora coralli]
MASMRQVAEFVSRWFVAFVLLAAVVGMVLPAQTEVLAPAVPYLLGLIMFGMGLTLRLSDFTVVGRHPQAFGVGVLAQFVVMPCVGWVLGAGLGLSPELAVGMILVGAAPGGTASNVVVYLAKGDVALSVAMTSASTLLAPLLTPLIVLALAGSTLPVNPGELFVSIVAIVLVPVVLGVLARALVPRAVEASLPVLPCVSVLGIAVVVAAVVGGSAEAVFSSGVLVLLAVVLHNGFGLLLGYGAARLMGLPESARRAISVEVGMQNSGLAASLATTHFTVIAALPAAVFSLWHNVSGAVAASYWARRPIPTEPESADSTA